MEFNRKCHAKAVISRSNVIQYDDTGYPLRLCMMSDGNQMWIDTDENENDIVLKWTDGERI